MDVEHAQALELEQECLKPGHWMIEKMTDCPCGYRSGSRPMQIGCGAKDCPFRQSGDKNG